MFLRDECLPQQKSKGATMTSSELDDFTPPGTDSTADEKKAQKALIEPTPEEAVLLIEKRYGLRSPIASLEREMVRLRDEFLYLKRVEEAVNGLESRIRADPEALSREIAQTHSAHDEEDARDRKGTNGA